MMNKPKDKTMLITALACFVAGIILPFFVTSPLSSFIGDSILDCGICNPMSGLFVFFGVLIAFALVGMGPILATFRDKTNRILHKRRSFKVIAFMSKQQ